MLWVFCRIQNYSFQMWTFRLIRWSPLTHIRIQTTGIQVAHSYITYLGIKIGRHTGSIYPLNYPPLWQNPEGTKKWSTVMMISFARLLYPLQTIPVLLRYKDIATFNSALTKFIWAGKWPCISLKKLQASSLQGGLNLPQLRGYNIACLSRHWLDWMHGTQYYSNREMEESLTVGWSLVGLLHAKFSMLPTSVKTPTLLRDLLVMWKELQKKFGLSHQMSRLLPLWSHVEFPAGKDSILFDVWKRSGLATAGQHFHDTESR